VCSMGSIEDFCLEQTATGGPPWAKFIFALDSWLRRRGGCVRIQLHTGLHFFGLSSADCPVMSYFPMERFGRPGDRVIDLHFWNEQIPCLNSSRTARKSNDHFESAVGPSSGRGSSEGGPIPSSGSDRGSSRWASATPRSDRRDWWSVWDDRVRLRLEHAPRRRCAARLELELLEADQERVSGRVSLPVPQTRGKAAISEAHHRSRPAFAASLNVLALQEAGPKRQVTLLEAEELLVELEVPMGLGNRPARS